MHVICRRCSTAFDREAGPSGGYPAPCPRCGAADALAAPRVVPAAPGEPADPAFSAPVSQPLSQPLGESAADPAAILPYGAVAIPAAYGGPHAAAPTPYAAQPGPYPANYPPPYRPQEYAPIVYPPPTISVVIQNQIQGWPVPVVPTGYPIIPTMRGRKDAGVAALLSFFLPGAGQLYNGQIGKGLAFIFAGMVNFVLLFAGGLGLFTGLVTWIWAMVDAHVSAGKINRGEIIV